MAERAYYRDQPPDAATIAMIEAKGDTVVLVDRAEHDAAMRALSGSGVDPYLARGGNPMYINPSLIPTPTRPPLVDAAPNDLDAIKRNQEMAAAYDTLNGMYLAALNGAIDPSAVDRYIAALQQWERGVATGQVPTEPQLVSTFGSAPPTPAQAVIPPGAPNPAGSTPPTVAGYVPPASSGGSSSSPAPTSTSHSYRDAILAMAGLPATAKLTADQWAWYYSQVVGEEVPSPEEYGFEGTGRNEAVTLDEWIRRLMSNPTINLPNDGPVIGSGSGTRTTTTRTTTTTNTTNTTGGSGITGMPSTQTLVLLVAGAFLLSRVLR